MASLNKVILIGHLGADPDLRDLPDGTPVASLRLATTETWKDQATGEKREPTEWHRLSLFRGLADIASRYLKKGSPVYVEGRLRTRKWTDPDRRRPLHHRDRRGRAENAGPAARGDRGGGGRGPGDQPF